MFQVSGKRTNGLMHACRDREEEEFLHRQMVCDGFNDVRIEEDEDGEDARGAEGEE